MFLRDLKPLCLVLAATSVAFLPLGCKKAPPITLSASAAPPAVFQEQTVTVTATAGSVNPNQEDERHL